MKLSELESNLSAKSDKIQELDTNLSDNEKEIQKFREVIQLKENQLTNAVQNSSSEQRNYNNTIQSLEKELTQVKKSLEEITIDKKKVDDEISECKKLLSQRSSNYDEELERKMKIIMELQNCLKDKEQSLESLRKEAEVAKDDFDKRNMEFISTKEEFENKISSMLKEKEKSEVGYKSEIAKITHLFEEKVMGLDQTLKLNEDHKMQMSSEHSMLQETLKEKDVIINDLKINLTTMEENQSKLRSEINQTLETKSSEIENLTKLLKDSENEYKILLKSQTDVVNSLEQEKSNLEKEIESKNKEITLNSSDKDAKVALFVDQIKNLEEMLAEIKESSDNKVKEVEISMKKMKSDHDAVLDQLHTEIDTQQKTHASKIEQLQVQNVRLEEEKDCLLHSEKSLYEQINKLKSTSNQHGEKYQSELQELQLNFSTKVTNLTQQIIRLQSEVADKDVELSKIAEDGKVKNVDYQLEVQSLQNKCRDLEKECEDLRAELSKLKNESNSVNKEKVILIKNLTEKLDAEKEVCERTAKKLEREKSRMIEIESRLIEREQISTEAQEEVMRSERESEKTIKSLKEENKSLKESKKNEQQVVEKLKAKYKTEIEKLSIQVQDHDKLYENSMVLSQKYETTKGKLSECVQELGEAKTAQEHYQKQVTKYKEHLTKLTENLKKEKELNAQLVKNKQPYKDKLEDQEVVIKRLRSEKSSLEAQVSHADSQLRDLKKQISSNHLATTGRPSMRLRESMSESQLRRKRESSTASSSSIENQSDKRPLIQDRMKKSVSQHVTSAISNNFQKPSTRSVSASNVKSTAKTTKENRVPKPTINLEIPDDSLSRTSSSSSVGRSVPQNMGGLFNCADEDEECFNNKYLMDMKAGRCNVDVNWHRISELQRRNSLYPPHMRSAYAAEMQYDSSNPLTDDQLRNADEKEWVDLAKAAENLELNSPTYNLRKRKSAESIASDGSFDSFTNRKTKKLSTSYSRPGPPTPGRKSYGFDKENRRESINSRLSIGSNEGVSSQVNIFNKFL